MLTRCPQCFAWFRVRAEQLSVANGLVTCGRCEHVFNALSSLIEEGAAAQLPRPPKVEDAAMIAAAPAVGEAPMRAAPLSFVAVTATPTITPVRASGALSVITTATTRPITLAEAPIAPSTNQEIAVVVSGDVSDAFEPPLFAQETALSDDLPIVDAHAAEIDPPPAEESADGLDIGPISTQLDDLDISDFDFAAVDSELGEPQASDKDDEVLHVTAAVDEDQDERAQTDPKYRASIRQAAPLLTTLPLIIARDDDDEIVAIDEEGDEDDHTGPRPEPSVPAVLLDDLAALDAAPPPSMWRGVAWTLFGLVLAALLALQLAFIERQALLAQVPDAAPLIDGLCARLPCLERREAATSVRLLARDVREHPSYRDALLVNATIVNDAKTPSPYPVIDLRLRDAAGNVLSARQFQPSEYLDQSIAIAAGMPAARPVYIVLELAGNASNAVSFEFTFL